MKEIARIFNSKMKIKIKAKENYGKNTLMRNNDA